MPNPNQTQKTETEKKKTKLVDPKEDLLFGSKDDDFTDVVTDFEPAKVLTYNHTHGRCHCV